MTKTARSMGGLFDWLKPAESEDGVQVQEASDAALEQTVIALFNEQDETAPAPVAAAEKPASAQEMFALLDALSAAERAPVAAPIVQKETAVAAPVQPAVSEFMSMPAQSSMQESEDDFGAEGAAESSYEPYETIHALPAEGWLISQLQYDTAPMSPPTTSPAYVASMENTAPAAAPVSVVTPIPAPVAAPAMAAPVAAPMDTILVSSAMASPLMRTEQMAAVEMPMPVMAAPEAVVEPEQEAPVMAMDAMAVEAAPVAQAETVAADIPTVAESTEETMTPAQAAGAQLEVMATVGMLAGKAEQSAVALAARIGQGFGALRRALSAPDADVLAATMTGTVAPAAFKINSAPMGSAPLKTGFHHANAGSMAMPSMPMQHTPRYSTEAVESILRVPEASLTPATPRQMAELPMNAMPEWLEEKLALHHRWLESQGNEGKRFRYNGEDFSNVSFAGQRLVQAQFRGASLAGMDFRQADLDGADFAEADLSRTLMSDATANRTNFSRANLQFADMQGVIAEGANLNFTDLHGARMREANFTSASFREANFQGVVAMDVVLANANMRGVQLFETIFPGADLRGADLRTAHLERTVFTGAQLAGASLKDAELANIDYSQADFTTALDVPQEVQLLALGAERTKLNTARDMLESRLNALQQREQRLMANLRVLEQKRHQDALMEKQENELFAALARHATWLWRGSFWWAAIVGGVSLLAAYGVSVTPIAAINLPVLGAIAVFVVVTAALALLSFNRVRLVRRGLMQLLRQRQSMKAALAAQAAVEVANAEMAAVEKMVAAERD